MFKLIQELLSSGKIITLTVKDSQKSYEVEQADLDEHLYTLTDGRTIYIAPDQVATVIESIGQQDPRLDF